MYFNEESKMQFTLLTFLWLEYLWQFYLKLRQHRLCQKTATVPPELKDVMTQETFDKARLYTLDESTFCVIKDFVSVILSTIVISTGFFYYSWDLGSKINPWDGEISQSCMFLLIDNTISMLINIPFNVYYTFVLKEKHGFHKQTVRFFVIDKLKDFVLSQVLSVPAAALAIYIVQIGGDYFFVWLWLAISVIMVILFTVYPAYIAPLFDKYTPLPEGELRSQFEKLAAELQFPLGQLYVVEGSKRTVNSNAYCAGLFGFKRIVLFDTLLESSEKGGCSNDEILAILSHELGHWQHGHVNKYFIIIQVDYFLMMAAFALMFKYAALYAALGFPVGVRPILVGLIAVPEFLMAPYNALLSFLYTILSRRFEFQADAFVTTLGRATNLKRALIKLNKDTLGFPIYDYLYSTWHLTHPPLLERMNALPETKKEM